MEGIFGKLFEKLWFKPISIVVLVILHFLLIPTLMPSQEESYTVFFIVCILIFILDLYYLKCFMKHFRLPKAKEKDLAILFVIDVANNKQFKDCQRKIIKHFSETIISNQIPFKVLYIQYHNLKKIDIKLEKDQKKLLEKTNCRYLIQIKIDSDDDDNANNYEMTINTGVIYSAYNQEQHQKFLKELYNISLNCRTLRYEKKEKIQVLHFTTEQMAYACKYIFGLTYLLDGNLDQAEIIFRELLLLVNQKKIKDPVGKILNKILPLRCWEIQFLLAIKYYEEYNDTEKEESIDKMHIHLNNANEYYPNTYGYYLNMAIYHVLKNRAINEAKSCIKKCKEITPNGSWKYSEAFLLAYESHSPLTIYRKYKQAFRVEFNLQRLTIFIERILDEEPDKNILRFALGLLYNEIGNTQLMQKNFKDFLNNNNKILDDKLIRLLKDKFSIEYETHLKVLEFKNLN